jgi:cell division protein FtsX
VAAVIRHALAEGWELIHRRLLVTLTLASALAVPLCLAGLTFVVSQWLEPLVALGSERSTVAVLLHPRMDEPQREEWRLDQERRHPDWAIAAVPPEMLAERLSRWFPYLGDILRDEGLTLLPPLVEVTTVEPDRVGELLSSPAVLAVGPRTSLNHLIGRTADRLKWTFVVLSAVLLASAAVLAAVWVHLEVYRHADEITIMRLLGAAESTIRGPFVVGVCAPGLLAAALSASGTAVLAAVLSRLAAVVGLPPLRPHWGVILAEVVVAASLPLLAAGITLARHAREELDLP